MKTKVFFIHPQRVQVETPDGSVYVLLYLSPTFYQMNAQVDNLYLSVIGQIFDKYYDGTDDSIWGAVSRGFYLNNVPSFISCYPDRSAERIRVGERIREMRKEQNMDAKELASLVGIDPANLSRIEKGRFSVGLDILAKIASVFKMRIDFTPMNPREE